ncbi:MAG: integrase [Bacteroidetes bacterium]|nr:MAG: integrase [Bacteroidota bacterium]
MKLSDCIHQFFDHYMPHLKGASKQTIDSYRNVFTLFLPFAARYHQVQIQDLQVQHLSFNVIVSFLDHIEDQRNNSPRTRNQRLAAIKSFAKMIGLIYPEQKDIARTIQNIPQKRAQKKLIGYLTPDEILKVFQAVDLKKPEGIRDYTILHLLADSGARAAEISDLKLDYFDPDKNTLAILGKGNRYRQILLLPKTAQLMTLYIDRYRPTPGPLYQNRLFVNQRAQVLTRHGIYRMCKKYLGMALPEKRLKTLSPAHSFRHSCAVNMLAGGKDLTQIKNRLGHEKLETTMGYLRLELEVKAELQKTFIEFTASRIAFDKKVEALIDWEAKEKTLAWLDKL